jgi:hypothetical protein
MCRGITIRFDETIVAAELNESITAALIWEVLPIEAEGNLWGEEIYFSMPVEAKLEDTARDVVERRDMGYWPQGRALCIFFGPTPLSRGNEIRPASAVNIVGRIKGDYPILRSAREGTMVRVEKERQ